MGILVNGLDVHTYSTAYSNILRVDIQGVGTVCPPRVTVNLSNPRV